MKYSEAAPSRREREPAADLLPERVPWYELQGVHPDDGREEIIAALESEARENETWYEAINVWPDATRREFVDALRREFDHVMDAIDDEIGDFVREKYGPPRRRR